MSILRRFEAAWKRRLLIRTFGLNGELKIGPPNRCTPCDPRSTESYWTVPMPPQLSHGSVREPNPIR